MVSKKIFPKDFIKTPHHLEGGIHWKLEKDGEVLMSIVGGARGLYGDGINTFEIWDSQEDDVRGYLTIKEINKHLKDNVYLWF